MPDVEREFDEDFGHVETVRDVHGQDWIPGPTPIPLDLSIGEKIAAEFCRDKVHLTSAEQRRLAGMIDAGIDKFAYRVGELIVKELKP